MIFLTYITIWVVTGLIIGLLIYTGHSAAWSLLLLIPSLLEFKSRDTNKK